MLNVWDQRTFDSKIELHTPRVDLLHTLTAGPLGRTLYALGQEGRIWQFELESGAVRELSHDSISDATAIALTPDSAELIVGGAEGQIGLLSLAGGPKGALLKSSAKRPISSLVVGRYQGGRVIAAATEDDSVVQVWMPGHDDPSIISSKSKVTSLGLANSILAIGDIEGNVMLHDLSGSMPVRVIGGAKPDVSAIAFDGSIARIATGTVDGKVRVFDFITGEPQIEFQATPRRILSMQFSPAGDTLMTAGEDHATRIWPIYRNVSDLVQSATALLPKASDRK